MQQHAYIFFTHVVVLCSLEQEGGMEVHHGQILSSKSGIVWIYGALKTTGNSMSNHNRIKKKTRSNHDGVIASAGSLVVRVLTQ